GSLTERIPGARSNSTTSKSRRNRFAAAEPEIRLEAQPDFPSKGARMTGDHVGNRRDVLGWLTGGGVVATALLAGNRTPGAGGKGDRNKVARVGRDAADRILPKGTWHSAVKVVDGKNVAYELDGSDGKDRDVTALVTAEGKVVEVETELNKPANVPDKVL